MKWLLVVLLISGCESVREEQTKAVKEGAQMCGLICSRGVASYSYDSWHESKCECRP